MTTPPISSATDADHHVGTPAFFNACFMSIGPVATPWHAVQIVLANTSA
jgi:hypothetical protein